jgi:cell division initiation protein
MARKDREKAEQEPATPSPEGRSTRITPIDIQQKEFRLAFRGYNEREVDEFLDQLTEEVARLHADNRRLQEQVEFHRTEPLGAAAAVGVGAVPGGGQGDERGEAGEIVQRARADADRILAEARDQGDQEVQRARAQAARILADADARASSAAGGSVAAEPSPAAPEPPKDQSAIRFLAREREFLQSLAGLIQRHAEAVKEDARSARRMASPPPASAAGPAEASSTASSAETSSPPPAADTSQPAGPIGTPQPSGPAEAPRPAGYSAAAPTGSADPAGSVDAPQRREPETWPPPPNGGGAEAGFAGEASPATSDDAGAQESWAVPPDPTATAGDRSPEADAGGPRFSMTGGEEAAAGNPTRAVGSVATASEDREPAPSSSGREEEARTGFLPAEPDRDDGEDRSLRELFWGEE